MLTEAALYQLLAWSSPGYPTGAFSYSHGLEWAVEAGMVHDVDGLIEYVSAVVERGGAWIDAVLFAHAWRAAVGSEAPAASATPAHAAQPNGPRKSHAVAAHVLRITATHVDSAALDDLVELAAAFRGSSETALESRQQGAAFLDVTRKAWPHPALDGFAERYADTPIAHSVVVALACAVHGIPLEPALHAYLHATAANLVSAGARLIPLGQTHAQIAIARLATRIAGVVERAATTALDDLGTSAPAIEICSLLHETQYTRLFRS